MGCNGECGGPPLIPLPEHADIWNNGKKCDVLVGSCNCGVFHSLADWNITRRDQGNLEVVADKIAADKIAKALVGVPVNGVLGAGGVVDAWLDDGKIVVSIKLDNEKGSVSSVLKFDQGEYKPS